MAKRRVFSPPQPSGDAETPSSEELRRKKKIIEGILTRRAKRRPLGITTAELVELARKERDLLYGCD